MSTPKPSLCLLAVSCISLLVACGTDRRRSADPLDANVFLRPDAGAVVEDGEVPPPADGGPVEPPLDAGLPDAGSMDGGLSDGGLSDAGRPDAGRPDAGPTICAPAPGRLAIVELMIASQAGTDRGEWFEVVSTASCAVDLGGLVLMSPTGSGTPVRHSVTGGLLPPGARYVFALSGDPDESHGLRADYVYGAGTSSDLSLGNAGDELSLETASGTVIDRVVWDTRFTRGAARQLPRTISPDRNDDWSAWCDSAAIYSTRGGTFYGTPGSVNGTCP